MEWPNRAGRLRQMKARQVRLAVLCCRGKRDGCPARPGMALVRLGAAEAEAAEPQAVLDKHGLVQWRVVQEQVVAEVAKLVRERVLGLVQEELALGTVQA